MTNADFVRMLSDPAQGQILAWQGKLRVRGTPAALRAVTESLFPVNANGFDGYYAALARLVPDTRLVFMNHGYAEEHDDFDWLQYEDQSWRYSINLVRETIGNIPVAGRRVLDVGCGRGGPCSYLRRYHRPAFVAGLDACYASAAFCRRVHTDAGLAFLAGQAERLPYRSGSFDLVLNVESAHCYAEQAAFFAEVARVLAPGGFFCYADTFSADTLAQARRVLSCSPSLRLVQSKDITAGVCLAIERNRRTFSELLTGMADPNLSNVAIIADLIRSVNVEMHEKYRSREWQYHHWAFEKVGE